MDLTKENKEYIDSLDVEQLLDRVRFAPVGDKWFMGETGPYWLKRLGELRDQDNDAYVAASKRIGWERR